MVDGKASRVSTTLVMNDVPLSVYKRFTKNIQQDNNIYWVRLKELILKAEAYDFMLSSTNQTEHECDAAVEPVVKEVVQTMGEDIEVD